jgi:hypothetical protein
MCPDGLDSPGRIDPWDPVIAPERRQPEALSDHGARRPSATLHNGEGARMPHRPYKHLWRRRVLASTALLIAAALLTTACGGAARTLPATSSARTPTTASLTATTAAPAGQASSGSGRSATPSRTAPGPARRRSAARGGLGAVAGKPAPRHLRRVGAKGQAPARPAPRSSALARALYALAGCLRANGMNVGDPVLSRGGPALELKGAAAYGPRYEQVLMHRCLPKLRALARASAR